MVGSLTVSKGAFQWSGQIPVTLLSNRTVTMRQNTMRAYIQSLLQCHVAVRGRQALASAIGSRVHTRTVESVMMVDHGKKKLSCE